MERHNVTSNFAQLLANQFNSSPLSSNPRKDECNSIRDKVLRIQTPLHDMFDVVEKDVFMSTFENKYYGVDRMVESSYLRINRYTQSDRCYVEPHITSEEQLVIGNVRNNLIPLNEEVDLFIKLFQRKRMLLFGVFC